MKVTVASLTEADETLRELEDPLESSILRVCRALQRGK